MATTKFKPTININIVLQVVVSAVCIKENLEFLNKLSAHLRVDNSLLHSVRVTTVLHQICSIALPFDLRYESVTCFRWCSVCKIASAHGQAIYLSVMDDH